MKFNSPEEAYRWALEHGPSDESREAVLNSPIGACLYARYIDKSPRDDTRKAVLSSPMWSYLYARHIDRSPRDDTRQAVLSDPEHAYWYTKNVDKETVHPDVDKAMKPFLLFGDESAIKLFKEFGDGK